MAKTQLRIDQIDWRAVSAAERRDLSLSNWAHLEDRRCEARHPDFRINTLLHPRGPERWRGHALCGLGQGEIVQ